MIPKECKRLAEVDFPIALVSKHAAKEKKVFGHHPHMLNQWWARRPLAACRAMLLTLLLPDPCDEHCPHEFKNEARHLLPRVVGTIKPNDQDLRQALLKFIGDFSNWDLSADRTYLEISRGLVKAAHGDELPLVVDPFAGGGSIPLEALRLGCEAFASDLNPVACLILKVLIEDIPRRGPEITEELRRVGALIKASAEKNLADLYPPDPDGARPIVYLWARTVQCESSGCGAEIPLVRSFWLCKKAKRKRALRYKVVHPRGDIPRIEFDIFEPRKDSEVANGTVSRAKAICPCCNAVLSPERVRAQLSEQRGGADVVFNRKGVRTAGARMLAVVTLRQEKPGRYYRLPTDSDYGAVRQSQVKLGEMLSAWEREATSTLCPLPDEHLPLMSGTFNVPLYGMNQWGSLFTARQAYSLISVASDVKTKHSQIREPLSFLVTRLADKNASLVGWDAGRETIGHVFNRQALPMLWDFAESAFPAGANHLLESAIGILIGVTDGLSKLTSSEGQVQLADAAQHPLPDHTAAVWFTDPPYYFAVPYADLSDFFFVWLKRVLPGHPFVRDPFNLKNPLTPKERELCEMAHWDTERYEYKDKAFFENGMRRAFAEGRRVLCEDGVGCVVFAHKTTEGWEALLSGMTNGGWTITGSWPIATERPGRLRARESAALATSVHLVCRPRTKNQVGDWGEVYRELPIRVGEWIERLQSEGVRGADLVFACIGPAMEIYSRYSKVEDAEGREIPLGGDPTSSEPYKRGFLAYVWETVGRLALQQVLGTAEAKARNGAAGALEEDARLTALFLWTLQSTNGEVEVEGDETGEDEEEEETDGKKKARGYTLIFDVVRRFAQPLGIHLDQWEGRIIETEKGIVRLLPISERAKQLFGEDGASAVATRFEQEARHNPQMTLDFMLPEAVAPAIKSRGRVKKGEAKPLKEVSDEALKGRREATTLDRAHAAMLLQSGGRANALRALLKAEQERGSEFFRLADALSMLYPKESEEKRLLDAMLLVVPR